MLILFSLHRTCRTRTNIGMKLVSYATSVAYRWWTSSSDRKWKKSIAETAMTLSLLLGATDAETSSAQVIMPISYYVRGPASAAGKTRSS